MKVVSVCSNDWANFAFNFSESLKTAGIDSHSYCLNPHPFNYEKQSEVVQISKLKELTQDADFIIVHHSCSELLPYISKRKTIHYAAGTKYRQEYHILNHQFKDAVTTFIALPEFQYLVPNQKAHYVVGAIDVKSYEPKYNGQKFFSHYPSNAEVKGSNTIDRVAAELKINYQTSRNIVTFKDQIKRMSQCDIYIELLSPTQGGKDYGSFGITCLEAAALGKVVISQNLHSDDLYSRNYGGCPVEFVRDEAGLRKAILHYRDREPKYIMQMGQLTRKWVEDNHSHEATGKRVLKILNEL